MHGDLIEFRLVHFRLLNLRVTSISSLETSRKYIVYNTEGDWIQVYTFNHLRTIDNQRLW